MVAGGNRRGAGGGNGPAPAGRVVQPGTGRLPGCTRGPTDGMGRRRPPAARRWRAGGTWGERVAPVGWKGRK